MEISRTTTNQLREFAAAVFELAGGVVEPVEDDLMEVLLPPELEGQFRPDLRIAFDPELAAEAPDSELLVYGSDLLDHLVAFAEGKGAISRVYLTGINLYAPNLEQNLKRELRFEGGDIRMTRTKVRLFKYLLFTFEVRYTTDEREEAFIPVVVNLHNGQIARRLAAVLEDADRCFEENYYICPEAESISVYQAYRIARGEMERNVIASLNFRKAAMEELIQREFRRIHKYYQDNDRELLERIEKEAAKRDAQTERTDTDRIKAEGRIDALESKRRVNQIERQRRLQEISDKYTLRTTVRLTNLLQIAYPKIVISMTVVDNTSKRPEGERLQTTISIIWNPLTQSPEPPVCPQCGKTTTTLRLVCPPRSNPQLVCKECDRS